MVFVEFDGGVGDVMSFVKWYIFVNEIFGEIGGEYFCV